ncbi:MAG: amidohydrolase [Deltaproteobacteria bacterium]|nr:amidohydrolase [Deltaproteobacteria bacterium]
MDRCAIDIHHHYLPPSTLEEAKRNRQALGMTFTETKEGLTTLQFANAKTFTAPADLVGWEKRLAMMDKEEIAIAALEPHTASLGYPLDGQKGEAWCRLYNDGLHELVKRYPDRFVALAAVPLQDATRAGKVLEHAMKELNFNGGYIGSNVNGNYYNSEEFDPFWKKAEELDALIVMHPEDVAGAERMRAYGMSLICGNPADSALSIGLMCFSGVFDRFPNLKLCVLHGGGFFPYHLGRFDQGFAVRAGSRAAEASSPPSTYMKKNLYFDTLVYRLDTLDYLRRLAGNDRLMIGTDYPYTLGDFTAVKKVMELDCSEAEKRQILEGNAKRLLKL